jgi:integrase
VSGDTPLNTTCLEVLEELHNRAAQLGFAEPTHFVFRWHGREKRLDPTRAMTSWRTAWRAMRKAAGLTEVRFHDGRHTAITTLAEKGLADWVIQAQVGHVAPAMMKTYSHIRRQALNEAAGALEPTSKATPPPIPPSAAVKRAAGVPRVTSQSTAQSGRRTGRVLKFA